MKSDRIKIRSKSGCLCCRKRRIKCDEAKPMCAKCVKAGYRCIWPRGKMSLSHNNRFKLQRVQHKIHFINTNCSFAKQCCQSHTADNEYRSWIYYSKDHNSQALIPISSIESTHDKLFRKYLQQVNSQFIVPLYRSCGNIGTLLTGHDMSSIEITLFDAFSRGFMVENSPLLAHERLLPGTVTLPFGIGNPILQQVFYTCGAMFLSHFNKDIIPLANTYLRRSTNVLEQFIKDCPVSKNEEWLLIVALSFCMILQSTDDGIQTNTVYISCCLNVMHSLWLRRQNGYLSCNTSIDPQYWLEMNPALAQSQETHIITYHENITKLKFLIHDIVSSLTEECMEDPVDNVIIQSTPFEFLGELIDFPLFDDMGMNVSEYEKTISESFIYNYSIGLFGCGVESLQKIDSPFQVFDVYRNILTHRSYKCAVPWMNNPIMGAALSSFELAAKVNWLAALHPLDSNNKDRAKNLLASAQFFCTPILPPRVKISEPACILKRMTESCNLATMVSKACVIFLKKLLDPDLKASDKSVQLELVDFIDSLSGISMHSNIAAICIWPMAVAGSAAIYLKDRNYLLLRIKNFKSCLHTGEMESLTRYLNCIWTEKKDRSLDALLDLKLRKIIFE